MRGYRVYQDTGSGTDPRIGEVLPLQREPDNPKDMFAVASMRRDSVAGHLPFNLAQLVSAFLRRGVSKGPVAVTGTKTNRGGGYGLEIPCTYRFYGSKSFIETACGRSS